MSWTAEVSPQGRALRYRLLLESEPLSFRQLFALLANDTDFTDFYSRTLVDSGLGAFFWEHPPLTVSNIDAPAEFVLLPAPALAGIAAQPGPFAPQFARQPGREVITFENLSGDALLIVPAAAGPIDAFAHLGAFLRGAPVTQVRELWRATAGAVHDYLGETPRWLSTSGLGVAWLHLRLDTRPKYYQHTPYRSLFPNA